MSKRPKEGVVNERPRQPQFEPDGLDGLRGEANEAEEGLIETHIAPLACGFYEQQKTKGLTKSFCGGSPSPKRFLRRVKILTRTYIRDRESEAAYDRVKARKAFRRLDKAFSLNSEQRQYLKDRFIARQMSGWNSPNTRSADELLTRLGDLERSFDGLALAVQDAILGTSTKGRKPQHSVQHFVYELAFAWCYLAGEPPTYARGDSNENSPFRELLSKLNNLVLLPVYQSPNDFDSYGVDAVKFARGRFERIESTPARVRKLLQKT